MAAASEAILFAQRVPNTLEDKFPGFKASFGGEELRRAQAALTCSQVGGTIEALVATDLPPSLARLSSLSQAPNEGIRIGLRHRSTVGRSSEEPGSPVLRRTLSLQHDPQQVAVAELNFLAQAHQQELERLGVVPAVSTQSLGSPVAGRKLPGQAGSHAAGAGQAPSVSAVKAHQQTANEPEQQVPTTPPLQPEQQNPSAKPEHVSGTPSARPEQQATTTPPAQPEQQVTGTQAVVDSTLAAIVNEAANRLPSLALPPESADGVVVQLAGSDVLPGQPPPGSTHDGQVLSAQTKLGTESSLQTDQQSVSGLQEGMGTQQKKAHKPAVATQGQHQAAGLESVSSDTQLLAQGASATAAASGLAVPSDPAIRSAAYEAAYGLGLVLQDLAARSRLASAEHLTRLQEACDKYRLAVKLRPSAHSALYNWGVALSDLAQAMKQSDPNSARLCLEAAATRYAQALAMNPDMPQALNNWGLVLQELSGLSNSKQERDVFLRQACTKFRQAIRLRPDFDRACYNLGTVCYGAACMLQNELAAAPSHTGAGPFSQTAQGLVAASTSGATTPTSAAAVAHDMAAAAAAASLEAAQHRQTQEAEVRKLFMCAAQYICLAYALQQHRDIYRKSLSAVRPLLRLPFLRVGYLSTPVPTTRGTPEEAWRQDWFVLDANSLRSATGLEGSLTAPGSTQGLMAALAAIPAAASSHTIMLPLHSIAHVCRLRDPTLPQGSAFCVMLHGAQLQSGLEIVMVAEDDASADVWVDMLLLAAHVVQSRATEALADALMPTSTQHQQPL